MLEVPRTAPVLGPRTERVVARDAASSQRPENWREYPQVPALSGKVLLEAGPGAHGASYLGVRDGNRSLVLPEVQATVDGRAFALSVKGVGARPPLYGDFPAEFAFRSDFGAAGPGPEYEELEGARQVTAESWFGESPYGAQGDLPAKYSLMVTEFSRACRINGLWVCPTIEVNELPDDVSRRARDRYWYRRNAGRYLQEQRLVPSNVRVFHESEWTLGQSPTAVLDAFGVRDTPRLDAFIDRYIASGVAALTVYVRTLRETEWGFRGLTYADVYLDKDAVIAPDGTMFFVDLEGLDWTLGGADVPAEERIREQFNYNFYEVMYGLDILLRERERMVGRPLRQDERRFTLPERLEMALAGDPFVRVERSKDAVDLVVCPPFAGCPEVPIRVLDLR